MLFYDPCPRVRSYTQRAHCSTNTDIRSYHLVRSMSHLLKRHTVVPLLTSIVTFREHWCSCDSSRRWRYANKDFFGNCVPVFSGPLEQAAEKQRRAWRLLSSLFAVRKAINESLSTIDSKRFSENGFWRGAHIRPAFIVLNHQSTVI